MASAQIGSFKMGAGPFTVWATNCSLARRALQKAPFASHPVCASTCGARHLRPSGLRATGSRTGSREWPLAHVLPALLTGTHISRVWPHSVLQASILIDTVGLRNIDMRIQPAFMRYAHTRVLLWKWISTLLKIHQIKLISIILVSLSILIWMIKQFIHMAISIAIKATNNDDKKWYKYHHLSKSNINIMLILMQYWNIDTIDTHCSWYIFQLEVMCYQKARKYNWIILSHF